MFLANRIQGALRNINSYNSHKNLQPSTLFCIKIIQGKRQKCVYKKFPNVQYNGKNSTVKTAMDSKYNVEFPMN